MSVAPGTPLIAAAHLQPAGPPPRRRPLPPWPACRPPPRRWLSRAIAPGSEPIRFAELSMHGSIRIGRWRPFRARQVIDPAHGCVWTATAGKAPMVVRGFDRYADGQGEMRWRCSA